MYIHTKIRNRVMTCVAEGIENKLMQGVLVDRHKTIAVSTRSCSCHLVNPPIHKTKG
jgi:hypothetical protein